jgi:hypothetical protein
MRRRLKRAAPRADPRRMRPDIACPICNADVPLAGDEKKGDEVFCTYCGAPLKLAGKGDEFDEAELEEDF